MHMTTDLFDSFTVSNSIIDETKNKTHILGCYTLYKIPYMKQSDNV
jgi:hypothetical protein